MKPVDPDPHGEKLLQVVHILLVSSVFLVPGCLLDLLNKMALLNLGINSTSCD